MKNIAIIKIDDQKERERILESIDEAVQALKEGIPLVIAIPIVKEGRSPCCFWERKPEEYLRLKHGLKYSESRLFLSESCSIQKFELKDEFGEPLYVQQPRVIIYQRIDREKLFAAQDPLQVYVALLPGILEEDRSVFDRAMEQLIR